MDEAVCLCLAIENTDVIMLSRADYISKFMRSSDLIFEEFGGLFGTHYH